MKVVVALDSFKGSLSAKDACHAVAEGLTQNQGDVEVLCLPISDGGDGLLDAVHDSCLSKGFREQRLTVSGPYTQPTTVTLLVKGSTCLMETAPSRGLDLVPKSQRRTMFASTY